MKKVFSLALIALIVVSCMATTAFAVDSPSLSGKGASAVAGGTASVSFSVSETTYANFSFEFTYDSTALELTGVTAGGAAVANFGYNEMSKGTVRVNAAQNDDKKTSGTIFTASFNVTDKAVCGNSYDVVLTTRMMTNAANEKMTPGGATATITLNHKWGEWTETAATCTEDGSKVRICSICGEKESKTIAATGHTEGEAVQENIKGATCQVKGSYDEVVYCSVCGAELSRETVTGAYADHKAADAVKENEVAATCTEKGSYDSVVYCSVCGEELSRETISVDALGHKWGDWTETKAATCSAKGEEKRVCSVCKVEETRETDKNPNNHNIDEDVYEHDKDNHWHVCKDCGAKVDVEKHSYATNEDGKLVCKCGYEKPTTPSETKDPTDDDEPGTGDMPVAYYVMPYLVLAAAVLMVVGTLKRKFAK